MKLLAATVCVLGVTAVARASVWEQATSEDPQVSVGDAAEYDAEMDEGDQATRLAASQSTSSSDALKLVLRAARSYERAAEIRPDRAEPHWRAADVLYTMLVDCPEALDNTILCDSRDDMNIDTRLYRRIIGHWDKAQALEPLDPRVKSILFSRAIMHTKLATDDDLALARDDYELLLNVGSSLELAGAQRPTMGNLSETYMMLGDLDHAITQYLETILVDTSTGQMYGLAVAYDRDEQGAKAKEIIVALGQDAADQWSADVDAHSTFYVPEGEVWYYKGLVAESLGSDKEAVVAWKRYLESGAHPQFQPRAKDHLDKLKAKLLSQAAAKAAASRRW